MLSEELGSKLHDHALNKPTNIALSQADTNARLLGVFGTRISSLTYPSAQPSVVPKACQKGRDQSKLCKAETSAVSGPSRAGIGRLAHSHCQPRIMPERIPDLCEVCSGTLGDAAVKGLSSRTTGTMHLCPQAFPVAPCIGPYTTWTMTDIVCLSASHLHCMGRCFHTLATCTQSHGDLTNSPEKVREPKGAR